MYILNAKRTLRKNDGGFVYTYIYVHTHTNTHTPLILPQGAPPVAVAALLIAINVKYLIKFKCSPAG